jgi:hypothetical protein
MTPQEAIPINSPVKIGITVVLVLGVLNFLAFMVVAIVGIVQGVSYPHVPVWFSNGFGICFFLGLFLAVVSLPFLASSILSIKNRAGLSFVLAIGTAVLIGFLAHD